jgi:hypothetical protein
MRGDGLCVEEIGRARSPQIIVPFSQGTVACYGSRTFGGFSMSSVMGRATSAAYGLFDRAWTAACWPLIAFLNLIFRPDPETGSVAWWRVVAWLVVNAGLLSFAVTQLDWRNLFWVLVAFLVVHILIMMSSLRIMYEEKRVMEGAMKPDAMRFSAFDAVNDMSILASSVVFYVAGLAALIEAIERSGMATILRHRPTLNSEYNEYLACVLNEVPIVNSIVNMAANLAKYSDNVTAQIVYNGWTGNGVRLLIVTTVSVIVVRALLLRFQQWSQQVSMAHAIESGAVSPESVKKRLVRMPTTLRDHLMLAALAHPDMASRRRALSAMAKLGVPNFARDFLMKLDTHLERDLGLAHIREACATMSASAREKLGGELAPILEKQMASIKDAIDMQTRARLEELKSMLKRA